MDKVKFNPFSEILDKDFNRQAEYVGDAVSMFIKDFLTEDKAVVLGLSVKAQAVADMTVYVAPGRLYQVGKQGQLTVNSNPPLTITAAHPDYERIDRVCARYAEIDDEPETRNVMVDTVSRQVVQKTVMTRTSGTVEFLVVSGVAAPVPAAPTVPDGWVSLAKVNVKQNASEVLQADIIDERPTMSAYLAHQHTGGGDGARIKYEDVLEKPDLNKLSGESVGHIGFTISNIPDGCLILDTGAVVSRATYPELWEFVQSNKNLLPVVSENEWQQMAGNQTSVVAFSTGDGSTTFRLPRLLGWAKGGAQADAGDTHEAGLPNITGVADGYMGLVPNASTPNGAFSYTNPSNGNTITNAVQHYHSLLFNASKSNSIYGTSAEVQPAGFVGVYYIRAFHGTTNEGLADVTALANEKAERDLSNISAAGKSVVANLGMPSGIFETVTNNFVNNNMSYIAPANGWLYFYGNVAGVNSAVQIVNNNTAWRIRDVGQGSTFSPEIQCPMKKGDIATLTYEGSIGSKGMRVKFIYAEGEI